MKRKKTTIIGDVFSVKVDERHQKFFPICHKRYDDVEQFRNSSVQRNLSIGNAGDFA